MSSISQLLSTLTLLLFQLPFVHTVCCWLYTAHLRTELAGFPADRNSRTRPRIARLLLLLLVRLVGAAAHWADERVVGPEVGDGGDGAVVGAQKLLHEACWTPKGNSWDSLEKFIFFLLDEYNFKTSVPANVYCMNMMLAISYVPR